HRIYHHQGHRGDRNCDANKHRRAREPTRTHNPNQLDRTYTLMVGPLANLNDLIEALRLKAEQLGLELFGITQPAPPPHVATYEMWVERGLYAQMGYMATERNRYLRAHPEAVMPEAHALLVVGMRYPNPQAISPPPAPYPLGRIASYAWGKDYHDIIPELLKKLLKELETWLRTPVLARIYSDTGPILERDIAQKAGLGWIGKNTCLIHPRKGSYFLLGEAFVNPPLPPTPPFATAPCGSCRRCIEACPTQCILPDRTLDASRCISYLTIENKGPIPRDLRSSIGNWVFGCDICQMVCPWNVRFASHEASPAFPVYPEIAFPNLVKELFLSPTEFKARYGNTPIMRARRRGYLRNIAVALGNAGDPDSVSLLGLNLRNEPDPLIRAHVAWALGRFRTRSAREHLAEAYKQEPDPEVQTEIKTALEEIT
ncbi:MAG: tRNA epoxyqueuosine(34) reductase QueG, partial [Thermanaerothrix sp.]|nr:tRNA epoxyqueuosine(34) reductase QueG [Thermanaerothrix sp.]